MLSLYKSAFRVAAALLSTLPALAAAEVAVSAEVEALSDYRYRGVSLSNERPALQATVTIESDAGVYLGGFASVVPFGGGPGRTELNAFAGYEVELAPQLLLDGSVSYYHYPSAQDWDYGETALTLSGEAGGTTVRTGLAYAPAQPNLRDAAGRKTDNLYGFVGVDRAISGTALALTGEAGYELGAFDGAARGGKLDWRLGLLASAGGLDFSIAYVGALRPQALADEERTERGVVLSIGRSF